VDTQEKAKWLEERRNYIGASDVGKLLLDTNGHCVHPYGSPRDVWLDKKGLVDFEDNERTLMGILLEPVVCQRFLLSGEQGSLTLTEPGTVQAPGPKATPWHRCNPDRYIEELVTLVPGTTLVTKEGGEFRAILQIKTAGFFGAQGFGTEGTDEVPEWYLAQMQWELYCSGADLAILGLLYDTHLYQQFLVWRDNDLINHIIKCVDNFVNNYLVPDIQPPVSDHKSDKKWLNEQWEPKPTSQLVATPEQEEVIIAAARVKQKFDVLKKDNELHCNRVRDIIREHSEIATTCGVVTWRADKNGQRSLRLGLTIPEEAPNV